MKNFTNPFRTLALGISIIVTLGGCSKEDPEAKKVNVPAMTEALKSPDKDTRVNACIELAKAGPRATPAVGALIPLLKDQEPLVRQLAAYALGQIGPKASSAIPALKELLGDQDLGVLSAALNALRSIDPKSTDAKIPNVQTPP